MKFSAKGHWSWELNGSVSDKIKKILGKLKNIINKDENNYTVIEANSMMGITYECSLDINADEMIQLLKCQIASDKNALEVLKDLGKSAIKGAQQIREAATVEIPLWQKIFHESDMQEARDKRELEKLYESFKKKSE